MKTFRMTAPIGLALVGALTFGGASVAPTVASAEIVGTCLGNIAIGEVLGEARMIVPGRNNSVNGNVRLSRTGDVTWRCETANSWTEFETACGDGNDNYRYVAAARLPNNAVRIDCY